MLYKSMREQAQPMQQQFTSHLMPPHELRQVQLTLEVQGLALLAHALLASAESTEVLHCLGDNLQTEA